MNCSTSGVNAGSGQISEGTQAPSSGNAIYNTSNCNRMKLEHFPSNIALFHPLDEINRVLLEEIPEAEIAIAHDDECFCDQNMVQAIMKELQFFPRPKTPCQLAKNS
ncbi:hypothetical protein GALMADRAFT_1234858 [Galerina marginata CBS 339.88]|uniref:Uncharacterized protein n=1 Tax=Galerina marginata (strain CBS 339.88) TaxID=685588 RepID=A0A067THF5_GALM3|nr:hypothetical protein GALMADRAFT_1234858 [Galerina marginata CBS 339.88]